MTLELTGRRYSSEKEISLKPWTSCSLFLCLEDLAAVFPEECLKHLTAKCFFSPYLIQLSPHAGESFCVWLPAKFTQNDSATTLIIWIHVARSFAFRLSIRKEFKILLVTHCLYFKSCCFVWPTIANASSQGNFLYLNKKLTSALSRNSNNNSVTNKTIQKQTIVAHFGQSVKCSYIRINGLAQLLVLLGYLIQLLNFISFAYNKASNFPSTASISLLSFSLSKLSPSTISSTSGPEHASNVDVLSSFDCLTKEEANL